LGCIMGHKWATAGTPLSFTPEWVLLYGTCAALAARLDLAQLARAALEQQRAAHAAQQHLTLVNQFRDAVAAEVSKETGRATRLGTVCHVLRQCTEGSWGPGGANFLVELAVLDEGFSAEPGQQVLSAETSLVLCVTRLCSWSRLEHNSYQRLPLSLRVRPAHL
jgi:hypothetical protein